MRLNPTRGLTEIRALMVLTNLPNSWRLAIWFLRTSSNCSTLARTRSSLDRLRACNSTLLMMKFNNSDRMIGIGFQTTYEANSRAREGLSMIVPFMLTSCRERYSLITKRSRTMEPDRNMLTKGQTASA